MSIGWPETFTIALTFGRTPRRPAPPPQTAHSRRPSRTARCPAPRRRAASTRFSRRRPQTGAGAHLLHSLRCAIQLFAQDHLRGPRGHLLGQTDVLEALVRARPGVVGFCGHGAPGADAGAAAKIDQLDHVALQGHVLDLEVAVIELLAVQVVEACSRHDVSRRGSWNAVSERLDAYLGRSASGIGTLCPASILC